MASQDDRIKEAKTNILYEASRRWSEREAVRKEGLDRLASLGPGAADTPQRVIDHTKRVAARAVIGQLIAMERILGPDDTTTKVPSEIALKAAGPVARITNKPEEGYDPQGIATGLLLPGGLLLTNHHVFSVRSSVNGYAANFGHAQDKHGVSQGIYFELDPDRFFISNKTLDFAIVGVKSRSTKNEPLDLIKGTRLIEAPGKILTGDPVNIIQHPGGGLRKFVYSNNQLVDILPEGFLHYLADTDRGSSGSAVFNRAWELVGLHHRSVARMESGNILNRDKSIWRPGDPENTIDWVANEGTRVSFIVNWLRQATVEKTSEKPVLYELIGSTADPLESILSKTPAVVAPPALVLSSSASPVSSAASVSSLAPEPVTPGALPPVAASTQTFNFSGPVTLNVNGSAPAPLSPPSDRSVAPPPLTESLSELADLVVEKSLIFDPAYPLRKGYDPAFLGAVVLLPTVTGARARELYTVADYERYYDEYRNVPRLDVAGLEKSSGLLLHYHHYSLVMNKQFRMCMFTASNCDYRDIERMDKRPRKDFGGENWQYDPRVPRELQLGNNDVYGPARRVDRGHIVRREDNAWGEPGLATEYANSDTYHWTNCTPQHEAFNQENPRDNSGLGVYTGTGQKGIWGQFEGDLQQQVERGGGQVTLFAGPVLRDFFKPVEGLDAWIPKMFWKVIVCPASTAKKPKLLVYGYVFDQENVVSEYGFTYERLDLPQFQRQRTKLKEITAMTGVTFPKALIDAEVPV